LLKILRIPSAVLPSVQNSGSIFGYTSHVGSADLRFLPSGIPIASVLGDQQAALYGQGCYEPGTIKNTYGTGCFIVLNTGKKLILSKQGLLSTIASDAKGKPIYAIEGSIFIAGAVVQWLRDQLSIVRESSETEKIAKGLKDTGGVYFVPAFTGLGAPYWNALARGMICGLTRGTNPGHITRAALESIAYQTKDVFDIMRVELGKQIRSLKVDGGACQNNFLMQFQADILDCEIIRPEIIESTAFGAAQLAGVTIGLWKSKKDLKKLHQIQRVFKPKMENKKRKELCDGWKKAIGQTQADTKDL
ncbi:MAG: glycerol kinase, partial [Candidatus Omnitrophica bacterium]|nr:glycerol kinase [Candidatus Omnitrophota bacterium]